MKPVRWELLGESEKLGLKLASEESPLAFASLWYNITQGEPLKLNWHHHYFKWAVMQMLEGKAQNIIINVPPGGTKTEFFSVHLPAYCFSKYERVRILNASYSKDLVNENSDRTRAIIRSNEYQELYSVDMGKGKVDDWTIEEDGKRKHQLLSRASGGQITGARGGFMVPGFSGYIMADDWNKPDDMFSETKRNKYNTRLSNTLRSRRATSETPFISVQQRVHVDDSTAYMLSGRMGLNVDLHVVIPAIINEEYIESLPTQELKDRCYKSVSGSEKINGYWSYWPDKEDVKDLMSLRESDPYTFTSQYEQKPESLDGGIFHSDDFRYYGDDGDAPKPDRFEYRFITADTAQKTKERNDYTVFAEWGVANGNIYRLGYYRGKVEAKDLRQNFESFCKAAWAGNSDQNGNLRAIYVEDKSSGTGLIQELQGKLPLKITPVQRNTDKLTRAMDVQPHHASGKVWLPYGDRYNIEFVQEVAGFRADDSHKHDDQTDVMIDALHEAIVRPSISKKKPVVAAVGGMKESGGFGR